MHVARLAVDLLVRVLPRPLAWRLGRAIYIRARGDHDNTQLHDQERFLQGWALTHLGVGEVFRAVDAGANVGKWTETLMAEAAAQNRAVESHAFEPTPATFAVLSERIATCVSPRQATAFNVALGKEPGRHRLYLDGDTAGTNSLHASAQAGVQPSVEVEVLTLDAHLESWGVPRVHLLKIDTEGHDVEVLQGATKALAAGRIDLVQFEYNFRWVFSRHFLKDVFDLAEAHGYRVGRCLDGEIVFFDGWNPELERFFECNLILMKGSLVTANALHVGTFNRYQVFS